ncbi:MAG: radical SAM protein [Niameybacter sp.]|uniref:radical SAM protein n=1 Tax=Niameybacter sp. TaxID=2033640 RepID=UPI002FCB4EC7
MIAQECNLKCKYCYGEGGEYQERGKMTNDIAIKSVDFLIENTKQKELLIIFFGGEPLMNFDLIKVVVEYCKAKEKYTDKKFRFSMTTNGTLINDKIEEYIRENNIFVQISIDGRKEVNDINRFNSSGEGIFDKVIARTHNLRKVNITGSKFHPFTYGNH